MKLRGLLVTILLLCCLTVQGESEVPVIVVDTMPASQSYISLALNAACASGQEPYRIRLHNPSQTPLTRILYLHDLQVVKVFLKPAGGRQNYLGECGIILPMQERTMPEGLVIPGYGYSGQLEIQLEPGIQELTLEVYPWILRKVPTEARLYTVEQWDEARLTAFEKEVAIHLLVIGALLMLAVYHLLVFIQYRDSGYLWYVIYTLSISSVLMIESGIFQVYITPAFPRLNLLYRYLLPHAFLTYVVYLLFLRSFVRLPHLIPWLDKILLKFLVVFSLSALICWPLFVWNLDAHYANMTWLTFALPISALAFGMACYFPIIKARNKLVNLFVLGSMVLLLGVFINTFISAAIEFGWLHDFPFPHFYITEIAVLIEILVFALAVGYRFRMADFERRRIKELDGMKSRFFANISHEFRTPLTIISGLAGQLKGNQPEVELIQRNSGNLLLLVNRLLELSKLDAGQLKMEYITTDIIVFLRYLTESFYSLAEQKQIQLAFEANTKSLLMDIDEMNMQQIVSNLLSNAIKFTTPGGQVILTADHCLVQEREVLQITVRDTGIGIPEAKIEYIFDRFYQVNNDQRKQSDSSGIGLALTKELVELAKGQIRVQSEEGVGSTFSIQLPVVTSHHPTQHSRKKGGLTQDRHTVAPSRKLIHSTPAPDHQHLLIIEDNQDIVTYLKKLLDQHYTISVARDGQEGIEVALSLIPDIIISDVMMPKKDGFEVCETLKKDVRTSHVPIILLTARAAQEDKIQGLQQGTDAYLMKPFDPDELFIRLEKLLGLRTLLQQKYSQHQAPPYTAKVRSLDDQFLLTITNCIESRIDDPELKSSDLEKATGLSNMQFYRKLRALTNLSPTLFIRSVRLQQAKRLLQDRHLNVSEVAYASGFSDPAYFSRVFKEAFGIPPSEI